MTDADIIEAIIQREGGYNDVSGDEPTNFGIKLSTLAAWRGTLCTADDVKQLSIGEARAIYRSQYLVKTGIQRIVNDDVRAAVLDAAVQHGQAEGIRVLQRALGVHDDGILGPVTLTAIPHLDGRRLAMRVLAEDFRLYGKIITAQPAKAKFAAGWMDRKADMLEGLL